MQTPVQDVGDLELAESDQQALDSYCASLRASPHNLLSRRGIEELEHRHIPECLGLAAALPEQCRSVLDVGSGGGLPGVPVAIARRDIEVTLLDATAKKMRFVAESAASAGVSLSTLIGRAEELMEQHGASFDVVTARAVAPLERLLTWTIPFLRPGGSLYAMKGERWQDELRDAASVMSRAGLRVDAIVEPGHEVSTGSVSRYHAVTPRAVIIRRPG